MKYLSILVLCFVSMSSLANQSLRCSSFVEEIYAPRFLRLVKMTEVTHSDSSFTQGERVDVHFKKPLFTSNILDNPRVRSAIFIGAYRRGSRTVFIFDFGKGELKIMDQTQVKWLERSNAKINPSLGTPTERVTRILAGIYSNLIGSFQFGRGALPLASVFFLSGYTILEASKFIMDIPALGIAAAFSVFAVARDVLFKSKGEEQVFLKGAVYVGQRYLSLMAKFGVALGTSLKFTIDTIIDPRTSYERALDILSLTRLRFLDLTGSRIKGLSRFNSYGLEPLSIRVKTEGRGGWYFHAIPSKTSRDPRAFTSEAWKEASKSLGSYFSYFESLGIDFKSPTSIFYLERGSDFPVQGPRTHFSRNHVSSVIVSPVNTSYWQGVKVGGGGVHWFAESLGWRTNRAQGDQDRIAYRGSDGSTTGFLAQGISTLAVEGYFGKAALNPLHQAFIVDYLSIRAQNLSNPMIGPRVVNGYTPLREGRSRTNENYRLDEEGHLRRNSLSEFSGDPHLDSQLLLRLAFELRDYWVSWHSEKISDFDALILKAVRGTGEIIINQPPIDRANGPASPMPSYLVSTRRGYNQDLAYRFLKALYDVVKQEVGKVEALEITSMARNYGFRPEVILAKEEEK